MRAHGSLFTSRIRSLHQFAERLSTSGLLKGSNESLISRSKSESALLLRLTGLVEFRKLCAHSWPPEDEYDEIIESYLKSQCQTSAGMSSDIGNQKNKSFSETTRVENQSDGYKIILSTEQKHLRNWIVLFEVMETECSELCSKFSQIKRRAAAEDLSSEVTASKQIGDTLSRLSQIYGIWKSHINDQISLTKARRLGGTL